MPTEQAGVAYGRRPAAVEAALLLSVAPILLFPLQFPVLTIVALCIAIGLWVWPLLAWRTALIPPTPYNLALLLWLPVVALGVLATADPDLTLPKATGLLLGITTWRYLVIYARSYKHFEWAVVAYALLGLGFTLVGLLNADWLLKSAASLPYLPALVNRMLGSGAANRGLEAGVHPNEIGGAITLYLPLLFSLLGGAVLAARGKGLVIALALLTLLTTGALLLTQSRGAWIGVLAGLLSLLVLWALLLPPSKQRAVLRRAVIALAVAGILLLATAGRSRIWQFWLEPPEETIVGSFSTLNFRQEVWPWAISAAADFPYTGTGLGTFRRVVHRLYPIAISPDYELGHAHNVFLQNALDVGLPGLIVYLALMLIAAGAGWRSASREPRLRAASIGLLASLLAFHVFGIADALALGSKPGLLLWFLLGLSAISSRLEASPR